MKLIEIKQLMHFPYEFLHVSFSHCMKALKNVLAGFEWFMSYFTRFSDIITAWLFKIKIPTEVRNIAYALFASTSYFMVQLTKSSC